MAALSGDALATKIAQGPARRTRNTSLR